MAPLTYIVLTALSLGLASAELKACGGAYYDPTQYNCYDTRGGLCPIINGNPTQVCGLSCYSPLMYSGAETGTLQLLPSDTNLYTLTALNPNSPFNGKTIEASGLHFVVGRSAASYCPSPPVPASSCPPGNTTVFLGSQAMDVVVPGGQQFFVAANGALSFTQAHSGAVPAGASYDVRVYLGGGFFGPGGSSWKACPLSGSAGVYQVFAGLSSVSFSADCVGFDAVVHDQPKGTVGAWQYA
ncbi:carbohydrate-binding module family 52 protein [Cryomyces antarcticus]